MLPLIAFLCVSDTTDMRVVIGSRGREEHGAEALLLAKQAAEGQARGKLPRSMRDSHQHSWEKRSLDVQESTRLAFPRLGPVSSGPRGPVCWAPAVPSSVGRGLTVFPSPLITRIFLEFGDIRKVSCFFVFLFVWKSKGFPRPRTRCL